MTARPGTQNERKCVNVIDLLVFPLLLLLNCSKTKHKLLILHWFLKQNQVSSFEKTLIFIVDAKKSNSHRFPIVLFGVFFFFP